LVALHVLAGQVAGVAVGGLAPRLIVWLVRCDQQLLLAAIALAFVAYGFGQLLGDVSPMAAIAALGSSSRRWGGSCSPSTPPPNSRSR
jgi:potassium/hydrogen antiporter